MTNLDRRSGQVMVGVTYNLGLKYLLKKADEERSPSKQPVYETSRQRRDNPRLVNVESECGSDGCLRPRPPYYTTPHAPGVLPGRGGHGAAHHHMPKGRGVRGREYSFHWARSLRKPPQEGSTNTKTCFKDEKDYRSHCLR